MEKIKKEKETIEPIKPMISKFPKKIAESNETSSYGSYFEIKEWGEMQTGWDFGEDRDLIGKINRIIEWINNFEKMKGEGKRDKIVKGKREGG